MSLTATPCPMPDVITLEMAGVLERWMMRSDGSIFLLLTFPMKCPYCRQNHYWFVNRNGKTRCVDCDAEAEKPVRQVA